MSENFGYRQLEVWQRSMDLVEAVYRLTSEFPDRERFGLVSQLQRAAVSIPSNIAEGHAKRDTKDYCRHLRIAAGSLAEVETQIELSVRLKQADRETAREVWLISQEVARMLTRLIQSQS